MTNEEVNASHGRGALRDRAARGVTSAIVIVLALATPLGCRPRSRGRPTERAGATADTPPVNTPTAVTPPSPPSPPPPAPQARLAPVTGSRSFATSSKFVVPSGVTSLRIELTAGGGGGGASCTARRPGGSGIGHREVRSFTVAPLDILDVSIVPPERGRCGGGGGGRGGSAAVRGRGVNIFADGGSGGVGTGGGCSFCGGDGGPSSAFISW